MGSGSETQLKVGEKSNNMAGKGLTSLGQHTVPLDIKGCICNFVKLQIHPFIYKATMRLKDTSDNF